MSGITSNLSINKQQVAVVAAAATAAKRKEDDVAAAAQAVVATVHREKEALIAVVAAARKTLDEARACERAAALAWEKEKTIARHLEQQLTATQGIPIPQDDDDDGSVDVSSNSDTALTVHLHTQTTGLQNIRSFWNPRHPTTSGGAISCFSRFVTTPLMTTSSLTSPICPSIGLDWIASW
jgi:hypothetical protein